MEIMTAEAKTVAQEAQAESRNLEAQTYTTTAMDINYYETQPPRILGTDFPPTDSLKKEYSRSSLGLDDVIDPQYPWQNINTDTSSGMNKAKEIKDRKSAEVIEYVIIRSRYWHQYDAPKFYANDTEDTKLYTTGNTNSHTKNIETGIEAELGLKAEVFNAKIKTSLKWDESCTDAFSESMTHTTTQTFKENNYYLYWLTIEELALYRRTKSNPAALDLVTTTSGSVNIEKTDANKVDVDEVFEAPRLKSKKRKVLQSGEFHYFAAAVVGKTKFNFKNMNSDIEAQAELRYAVISKTTVDIPCKDIDSGETGTKTIKKYYCGSVRVTNSGRPDLEVWTVS